MDLKPEDEFWHELVLNGVGGKTIAEAKKNISFTEFHEWRAFRNKRGPFFVGRRIEQAIGNLIAMYVRSKVDKNVEVDALDYMPHEEKPVLSFEQQRLAARKKNSK